MVAAFKFLARDVIASDAPRAPLAAPAGSFRPSRICSTWIRTSPR